MVIDWEFARLGDPLEDLGYYLQTPVAPNLYLENPESFLSGYREQTGLTVEPLNPKVVEYFRMLGTARLRPGAHGSGPPSDRLWRLIPRRASK